MKKLGDIVHRIAQPIAKGIDYVFQTDIQHCSGCAQRREWLNAWSDRIYDFLWNKEGDNNMNDYVVTKQYAVMADDPEDAIANSKGAPMISVQAMLRTPLPSPPMLSQPQQPSKEQTKK
jgi:hypothetical protein